MYSGEVPGRAPQLEGSRLVFGGGLWKGVGGAYKTQTVKGVGVESPEEEVGRGLLIAVVIVSAIVGEVGVGVCSAMGGKVRKIEDGPRSTCFYTWLRVSRDIKTDPPGLVGKEALSHAARGVMQRGDQGAA